MPQGNRRTVGMLAEEATQHIQAGGVTSLSASKLQHMLKCGYERAQDTHALLIQRKVLQAPAGGPARRTPRRQHVSRTPRRIAVNEDMITTLEDSEGSQREEFRSQPDVRSLIRRLLVLSHALGPGEFADLLEQVITVLEDDERRGR